MLALGVLVEEWRLTEKVDATYRSIVVLCSSLVSALTRKCYGREVGIMVKGSLY